MSSTPCRAASSVGLRVRQKPDLDEEPLERTIGDAPIEITERNRDDTERNTDPPRDSRPPMRITWNAAPPTNRIRLWTAISATHVSMKRVAKGLNWHIPIKVEVACENIEAVIESAIVDGV